MMLIGYILCFVGLFLVFGNQSGHFPTFSYAGFSTGSVGALLVAIGWMVENNKAIKSYTEMNGDPVLKSGFSHIKGKGGEIRGALFLTKGGVYFKSNSGQNDISLLANTIGNIYASRVMGIKNKLNITLHDGTSFSFIVTGAQNWVEVVNALDRN